MNETGKNPANDGRREGRDGREGRDDRKGGGMKRFERPRPPADLVFDFKNAELLKRFITDRGKIIPARMNRLSAKQQRQLAIAVKRARHLALIPYCSSHHEPRGHHYSSASQQA